MTRPVHPIIRTATWIAGLVAALVALLATGDRLAPPPWPAPDPSDTWVWLGRTDPAVTTFALLRLVAIVVVAYLLVATVGLLGARLSRVPSLIRASNRLTAPGARRLIQHVAGAGLAVTLVGSSPVLAGAQPRPASVAPAPAGAGSPGTSMVPTGSGSAPPVLRALPGQPVLVLLDPPGASSAGEVAPGSATGATPTDPPVTARPGPAPVGDVDPSSDRTGRREPRPAPDPMTVPAGSSPASAPVPPAPATPIAPPAVPGPAASSASTVAGDAGVDRDAGATATGARHRTIAAGDHLWGIAEQTLADAWGRAPGPDEIAGYLGVLIDANRSVLAVPDDPDLVFPGQVFALPDLPSS